MHNSLWVQVKLSFWTVGLQLLLGFVFALLLNIRSQLPGGAAHRLPDPDGAAADRGGDHLEGPLHARHQPVPLGLRGLGFPVPSLITHPNWALTAIIIADIWEWFPFTMLMILAALQMMPEEYIEAAKVDGANVWQMTLYVTLPY